MAMKTMEDKKRLFLDMQEHPENYSDEELQAMLDAPDMLDVIENFEKLRQAALRKSGDISDAEISSEWEKFRLKHKGASFGSRRSTLFKVAAVFVGCLLMVGLAYAAVRFMAEREPMPIATSTEAQAEAQSAAAPNSVALSNSAVAKADSLVTFDDAEFESVLSAMAEHYGVKVEFKSDEARHIRMFFIWNKNMSLADVLEIINGYDRINVVLVDETLTVK